jgi:hypothetical protein
MNKAFRILEIIWLVLGFIGVLMCGYFIIIQDKQGVIYFIIFTVMCGLMYAVRRRQRMRFEANQKNK